ncbi:MAG: hypothetical protein FJ318_04950 [SAR202 cluster bacterium]|nr:hypothetical protein [SAR202 cluster bacterium]
MRFRVGHEVRFQTIIEAASEQEAIKIAESLPYDEWQHSYLVMEDVIPMDESPVNPQAGG